MDEGQSDEQQQQTDETVPSGPAVPKFAQGRYLFQRLLGKGGMGVVWLARDERLETLVAIKILPDQVRMDPGALASLRRETSRSQKLSHPNIIRLHDLHEDDGGGAFITMEYVDGANLSALRCGQPGEVFTWDALAPIARQLCEALAYAHEEKVVHRDLKPSNLMVDTQRRLKLADFGIAAVVSDTVARVTGTTATSGTVAYMSPQQMQGELPRATDDIYSLGATLYELLSGTPPFHRGEVVHQVLHKPAPPLGRRMAELGVPGNVPARVEAVIMACLDKNPVKRPQSVRELVGQLGLAEPGMPRPASNSSPKRRWLAAVSAILALGVVGILWLNRAASNTALPSVDRTGARLSSEAAGRPAQPGSSVSAAPPSRYLCNESFDNTDSEGVPVGWVKKLFLAYRNQGAQVGVQHEDNNRFLRMARASAHEAVTAERMLTLPPGTRSLRMSARVRGMELEGPRAAFNVAAIIAYSWFDADGKPLSGFTNDVIDLKRDCRWTPREIELNNIPPGAAKLLLRPVIHTPKGTFDVDDLRLEVLTVMDVSKTVTLPPGPAPAQNGPVVFSDDFEKFDPNGCPLGWDKESFLLINKTRGTLGFRQEGTNHFMNAGCTHDQTGVYLQGRLSLNPRWKRLLVSMRLRVQSLALNKEFDNSGAGIQLLFRDERGEVVGDARPMRLTLPFPDWSVQSVVVNVRPKATVLVLFPGLAKAAGSMDFDDLKITVVEEAPE